jgi:hypothetical protein
MHKLSENLKVDVAMVHATLNNSSNTPLWVSMKNYDAAMLIIQTATLAAGAALTCQLRQATSAAGAGAKNITGYSTTFTAAEDDTAKTIDVRAENLDTNNSFTYLGILITETGTQNAAVAATFVRGRARYAQATLPA